MFFGSLIRRGVPLECGSARLRRAACCSALVVSSFACPAFAGPCWLAAPPTVFVPSDGDSAFAHDGVDATSWAASDSASTDCNSPSQYADPSVKLEVQPHRPLILSAAGALAQAIAHTEGISDTGREVFVRIHYQGFGSTVWQVLQEWRLQDNGQFGPKELELAWRLAEDLPVVAVEALAFEVGSIAFANCDDDVVGHATGSVALREVRIEGRDAMPGDINLDGKVNLIDFAILKENFGTGYGQADLDGNGRVDLSDFGQVKENFGKEYPTGAAVPEPSTMLLALLALFLLGAERRVRRAI